MKYQSEIIKNIIDMRGHGKSSLHYESECINTWINEIKEMYPKECDYESELLSYIEENELGKNLLDIKNAGTKDVYKCSFINNNDGSITLMGTNDGTGEAIVTLDCYAYLEKGKKYTFSFESDAPYSDVNGTDTVEALLLKDASASVFFHQMKGFNTTFTCGVTGNYYPRFDINKNDTVHRFWSVKLQEE